MYYVSNKGTFIKLDEVSAVAPPGNMGLCEVHLKGGSVITMSDHNERSQRTITGNGKAFELQSN